ncbi:phosphatase PAP2 family protein [Nocardioides sp. MAHUQ-72]|uniref:phosphatase PAP2 family protein n=1 Tax=unclassified Nocardioides TaxID=2615069 RepID=UPI003607B4ED
MSPPPSRAPRRRRRFVVVAVVAVLAVLGGAVAPWAYSTFVNTSAKDRIQADPPPTLFPDSAIRPIGHRIDRQQPRAQRLMADWWSRHDATPDDAAFTAWLERTLPPPPSAAARAREIKDVQAIAPTRTDNGVAAATWLEAHGKKDVWKLAAHDQAELLPAGTGDALKNDVDDALSMAKQVADDLGAKYQQSAPYVVDPSLRPDHTVTAGQVCPCSYPSRHATAGAAAATYLTGRSPHRGQDYRWTLDEVAWSRVYMAGHVPSDITAGALLGDMIGEYLLVTRGREPVPAS